jgi:hypothetical protein
MPCPGTCVLFLYFGTVLATPLAGKLINVFGSKWATISSALLFICALPFIGMNPRLNFSYDEAQTRALLSATMFWFGFTLGRGVYHVGVIDCSTVQESRVAHALCLLAFVSQLCCLL